MSLSYSRFKPIHKSNDVRMFHALKHFEFVINHLLVALHIFLEDNFHGDLALRTICLSNYAVCPCAKGLAKAVFGPS